MPQDSFDHTTGTSLVHLDFEGSQVRIVPRDGVSWFVLVDVCRILGIANSRNVSNRLDDDEKGDACLMDAIGREQRMTIVSESGLYTAIMTSIKPEACRFRKWVTSEVLPAIRRTGSYGTLEESQDAKLRNHDVKIRAVSEARRLWGKDAAQKVWIDVGLPTPWIQDAPVHDGSRQESIINKEAKTPAQNIRQAESIIDDMHRLLKEITYIWISERDIIRNTRWLGYDERKLMIKALINAGEIEQRTDKSHLREFNLYRRVIGYVPGDKVHLVS